MDLVREYWWVIAIAVVLLLAMLLLRPKQKVTLTDSTPVRPHMQKSSAPPEGRGLTGEAAAAASDVAGQVISAPVHHALEDGVGADNLCRLKGVGPRFADALQAAGFVRFKQIASLSPNEVERLDDRLGAFRGRIKRDRIVEQADYLARNDTDGFEKKFGKL